MELGASSPSPQAPSPTAAKYLGRFAPSPSGPLHFGSLIAAVGSYLQARCANGHWLVRIEDLDTPRVVPGAADEILTTLDAFGFEWNGAVEYQSRRGVLYANALADLRAIDRIYPCTCSRSQLALLDDSRYPGTCRAKVALTGESAQRFIVESGEVAFSDLLQGTYAQDVAKTCGDFIVQRRDCIYAYHLAVVVDDAAQGVTEIVRGADLLDSTPRQILLQQALRLPTPRYCHLPLAVDAQGQKLSKSAQSMAVDARQASSLIWRALCFLRQSPPPALATAPLKEVWQWAFEHWRLAPLQQIKSDRAPEPNQISAL